MTSTPTHPTAPSRATRRRRAMGAGLAAVVAAALGLSGTAAQASAHLRVSHQQEGGDHPTAADKTFELTVLGTSDLHGNVLNWDYYRDSVFNDGSATRPTNGVGLAKVASMVRDIRAAKGKNHTLLLDSGDTIQGTPLATYFAKQEPITTTGHEHPMATAMNLLDYDATTLGNHEFNYGIPFLRTWIHQLDFPALAANAVDVRTGRPAFQPYVIKTMGTGLRHRPVRVGILGLTNPGVAIWDHDNVTGTLRFDDMVSTAQTWVPRMKAAGADVIIISAHGGDSGTSSYGPDLPVENAAALVAEQTPDVDAVLFGHAHNDVPQRFVTNATTGKQVLLSEPSKWGERLTEMTLSLVNHGRHWSVATDSATTHNTVAAPEAPDVVAGVAADHAKTVAYVNTVVARSTQELSAVTSRYQDTPILDFINKVQTETVTRAMTGTPYAGLPVLSIAAPFSRTAVFPQGDVRIRDVAGLYIYDNTLEAVTMTGAEVKAYLEYSVKYFQTLPVGATPDPATIADPAVPDYNDDALSGVDYGIDISKPVGQRITTLEIAGVPVAADQQFVVAVNNYRRSGGGGFPGITKTQIYNQQQEIRQLLIDWAKDKGVIDPADFFVPNWRLVREGQPVFPG